ncbi:hypothetical protein SAMN04487926_12143 [Paraburkholderia steynii]|uniref:Uncharacterized protein n=1 Tax=Paraburkholderia steynii TaxID=1245441 RepID=A0A7Z7BBY5_9BURK|nr:hypothetical protein [Paraburkholderia steynii]SDI65054.1 hypothetical protein SAMN04487926_12143 [Paraburkholderia steynii]
MDFLDLLAFSSYFASPRARAFTANLDGLIDAPPVSVSSLQIQLSDPLIAEMACSAAWMYREACVRGEEGDQEWFAELVIRATLGAINANREDPRMKDWMLEKRAIACLSDEQAEQSWARWKGFSYAA